MHFQCIVVEFSTCVRIRIARDPLLLCDQWGGEDLINRPVFLLQTPGFVRLPAWTCFPRSCGRSGSKGHCSLTQNSPPPGVSAHREPPPCAISPPKRGT